MMTIILGMQFKSLQHTTLAEITETFNDAFSAYEIPMQHTEESLRRKLEIEDIDLQLSVGAFDGDQLGGFIFFGIDRNLNGRVTAWDGGTGVRAAYRGRQITQKLFGFALPLLRKQGVQCILLEVLENNSTARNIYSGLGFSLLRRLNAYKGNILSTKNIPFQIENLTGADETLQYALGDFLPAWQQSHKRIQNAGEAVQTIGIVDDAYQPIAYARFRPEDGRVLQFAVHPAHRRKGMGTAIFTHIAARVAGPVSVVNVDEHCESCAAFLTAMGLHPFISQYEMALELS